MTIIISLSISAILFLAVSTVLNSMSLQNYIRSSFVAEDIKVAVMGCVVNGPGEAKEADIGIAGGDGCAMLFRKGTVLRKVVEQDIVPELMAEIEKL